MEEKTKQQLQKICKQNDSKILFDEPFAGHSTIGIGGNIAVWIEPSSMESLLEIKKVLDQEKVDIKPVGWGSNILVPDQGMNKAFVSFSSDSFIGINHEGQEVFVGAGASLGGLIAYCCSNGLGGLEGLTGIPASVGGALVMNASYKTSISEYLKKVLVLEEDGKTSWKEASDLNFGYRESSFKKNEIILQAVFCLEKKRPEDLKRAVSDFLREKRAKQPLDKKTLGCVFKNPEGAGLSSGELVEKCGFKGFERGAARFSEVHANFIENSGGAKSSDVLELMDLAKNKVFEDFSIKLEAEIEIL